MSTDLQTKNLLGDRDRADGIFGATIRFQTRGTPVANGFGRSLQILAGDEQEHQRNLLSWLQTQFQAEFNPQQIGQQSSLSSC